MTRFGIASRCSSALWRLLPATVAIALYACPLPSHGEIVINEIYYHPASENVREEFIELHNTGTAAVVVGGYAFTSGVTFTIPAATGIPAGGFLVVAADATVFTSLHPAVTNMVGGWNGRLSNSSNKITLVDAAGVTVDEVDYADDGDWAVRAKDPVADYGHYSWGWRSAADGGDASLELIQPGCDNSTGQNWSASATAMGTPGAVNSVVAADLAPLIREVAHFPLVPTSTDPVWVTAQIDDDHGALTAAQVHWRVDGNGAFASEPLADDGQHGDTLAGDGIFGAALPVQPNGTVIEFYLSAEDATAHRRTWPAPALDSAGVPGQTANCLYQVDNTVYAGAMPLYRMVLRAVDKAELTQINTDTPTISGIDQTFSEAQVNATFISRDGTGSELRYRCGLRNRGASSRKTQPQSYRINFLADESWDGIAGLNLNTQYTHSQLIGSAAYRKAGVAMAMARPVQVRVNSANPTSSTGTPAYGFYVANEVLNSDFAAAHFPLDSSGNIYRSLQINYSTSDPGGDLGDWSNNPDPTLASPTPYRVHYFKNTNESEDDWSDLIALTQKLAKGRSPSLNSPTWDADYATAVRTVADVEQWMRFFAVQTIADNIETNLSNGRGDDFSMYFGATDRRCRLIPYDLDSVFGRESGTTYNHSLWLMCDNPSVTNSPPTPVNPFMKHPEFAPIYFKELKRMIDGPLSPPQFNSLADEVLGGVVNASLITSMKSFNANRTAWIATQIPTAITVTTLPAVVSGYPKSTTATTTLGGKANAITTRSIKVNGVAATWTAWTATWTAPGVTLKPGLNRVLIQAFDATGGEFEHFNQEVWYDDGAVATAPTNITTDSTWTAAGGPWQVSGMVTVASGATLTIEPGATVYFASGAGLTISNGGRLLAAGTDTAGIRFATAPGSGVSWGGLLILGGPGSPESRLTHARFEGNSAAAVTVTAGDVVLDHLEFGNTGQPYLVLNGASFLISNCEFPTATAGFELVHGTLGVKTGGRGIIRQCYFGAANGYNDALDFTGGQRPGPLLQLIDNVFTGSGDDLVDLDGTDAWIEGNIFLHCHKNGAPDSAAAISGGDDAGLTSELTIVGNLFYDVDHVVTAKQGNYYALINNTVVRQTLSGGTDIEGAVLNLQDAIPTPPTTYALGLYAEANIFSDCQQLLRNYDPVQSAVTLTNNQMPFLWSGPGVGNTNGEPLFQHVPSLAETAFASWTDAQVMKSWLALSPGSAARGTGPNGRDRGGVIARGVCLTANVPTVTNLTNITLSVGPVPATIPPWAAGYTHYRWRLDGGAWSGETTIASPLTLLDLTAGEHRIEVAGINDAGYWQDDPVFGPAAGIAAFIWTVDTTHQPPLAAPRVVINEVLAKNGETLMVGGNFPDLIELYNAGDVAADLSGWGLTDTPVSPYRFAFAPGTTLAPGAYLVVHASSALAVPAPKTGFALDDQGETLTLTRAPEFGGGVADTVTFGHQLSDYAIGRSGVDGSWVLCRPTFGTANLATGCGSPAALRINEWLASNAVLSATDFLEIYNPGTLPVNLGGCYLTDNPVAWPDRHQLAPLTFVGAAGFALFKADGDEWQGPDHLSFGLNSSQGEIGLFDSNLTLVDSVVYGPQATDVSQGLTPNGGSTLAFLTQLTPGGPNPGTTAATGTTTVNLIPVTATWKYKAGTTSYHGTYQEPDFDDTTWPSGGQLLHYETGNISSASGFAKTTQMPIGSSTPYPTYYFRKRFTYTGPTAGVTLRAITMIDDAALIYLNGQLAANLRMSGTVTYSSTGGGAVGSGTEAAEETWVLPANLLVQGDNVIAVEVHQATTTSSDVVMGLKLDAETSNTAPAAQVVINEVLASNQSLTNPDGSLAAWVELYNPAAADADISDMSLGLSATSPRGWVAPAGTIVPAGGQLVIHCDSTTAAGANNSGLALSPTGGSLYLFHSQAFGGGLSDSVTWGNQLPDLSIGRLPNGAGAFALNLPSRGGINTGAATGSPVAVRVNEWLANPARGPDWFELYNTDPLPVPLGGNYLTDSLTNKTKQLLAPLSFIGGSGASRWLTFIADSNGGMPGHVNFALSASGEALGLFTAAGYQLDAVAFGPQAVNVSSGGFPDGSETVRTLSPTPGSANAIPNPDTDGDGMPDGWELANGLDPNLAADASGDADGDGMTNGSEYLAGTDPRDPGNRFAASVTASGTGVVVRFIARPDRSYTVQTSSSLEPGSWQKLADVAPQATIGEVSVADPNGLIHATRFYRVITPSQPAP